VTHHAAERDVSCTFKQLMNTVPRIPSAAPGLSSDGTLLLGYVGDSATRKALSGALIRLVRYNGNVAIDTTVGYSDSAGGFAIQLPARGRYRYLVASVNFGSNRDSIDVLTRAETLRVLIRGTPICDVRVTSNKSR
jgi:hypothetical protein